MEEATFPEGYGLQAVRKCFAMNSALAAEGSPPLQKHFFRSLLADTPDEFPFNESNRACR